MTSQRLTVQVVLWNNADTLPALLSSLQEQTLRDSKRIFVDNHSSDNSIALAATAFPDATIVRNQENRGFSAGHNQGFHLQNTKYTALINPDIVLDPAVLERCIAELDAHPKIASVGTKLLRKGTESGIVDSAGIFATRYREFLNRGEGERDQGQFGVAEEVFGVNGAFVVLRRAALESIRFQEEFLDEDLFAYKDDVDLAWRLRLAGWVNWYLPRPASYHLRTVRHESAYALRHRRSRKTPLINRLSYRNHWIVLLKNDRASRWLLPWPRQIIYELAKLFFLIFFEPKTLQALPQLVRIAPCIFKKRRVVQKQRAVPFRDIERWFV